MSDLKEKCSNEEHNFNKKNNNYKLVLNYNYNVYVKIHCFGHHEKCLLKMSVFIWFKISHTRGLQPAAPESHGSFTPLLWLSG